MRCSLCQAWNALSFRECSRCGAILEELRHRELSGVCYLLEQVGKWEDERRYTPEILTGLKKEYDGRRSALHSELKPAPRPAPPKRPAVGRPEPKSLAASVGLAVAPMERVRPVRPPPPPPPPPRPPFSWKNLYTEQNIRWVLNLGIFIFSIALAVFIRTQWREMSPGLKVGILYAASAAAIASGHLLRRTILKATGLALVLLGSIAVPIDCAALIEFGLVSPAHSDAVGLGGSSLSLLVYLGLAWAYAEPRFLQLGCLALAGFWAFLLHACGVSWPSALPWMAPLSMGMILLGPRPVRQAGGGLLGLTVLGSAILLGAGLLGLGPDVVGLQAACLSILLVLFREEGRTNRPEFRWGHVAVFAAMYAVAVGHEGRPFGDLWLSLALVGGACSLGWWRKSPPFMAAEILASILSLAAAGSDAARMCAALSIPAAIHVLYGLVQNEEGHSLAGWGLAGAALLSGMQAYHVPSLWQPLGLAGYGALVAAVSRRRTPKSLQILGVLGAGVAMVLVSISYGRYYLPRPYPGAAVLPGFQGPQLLGASIALVAAMAFGPLANATRSRYLSDITYGCLGFSTLFFLRWVSVPGKWLGLSVALFGLFCALAQKRVSRWLPRPTFFTGVACTVAAGVFAFLQWFALREYVQSALTLLLIGGFYVAAAARTRFHGLHHVGVYLIAAGWLVTLQAFDIAREARTLLTFLPAAAAVVGAARRRILHLGLASLVVAVASLAVAFLDPSMYGNPRLPYLEALAMGAAVLAGWFAFSKQAPRELDDRLLSALMGVFASVGYLLWLKSMSTGRPWGGFFVFAWTVLLGGAAEILRRTGFVRQALPLVGISWVSTALAILVAHEHGQSQGVHLWIYGASFALYTALGASFSRSEIGWAGAVAGALGLFFWLTFWAACPWVGVGTFFLGALALQRKNLPLRALGWLAIILCPAQAAWGFLGSPAAGVVFLVEAGLLAATTVRGASLYPMALGLVLAWPDSSWAMVVAFGGFALYFVLAVALRRPAWIYAALGWALLGDYLLAVHVPGHPGMAAYPLALVLLGMAFEVGKRFGREFQRPLLGASLLAAGLATFLGMVLPEDRIVVFLADAILFAVAAILFRRPELMYPSSASLVALALAFMWRYDLPRAQMAFYLLSLALGKMIFLRTCGGRLGDYVKPVYTVALLLAAGVLLFGVFDHRHSLSRESITWSIWALILTAGVFGIAGRIRRIPAFLYLAVANLLGGYYLALHKYGVGLWEAYTLPAAVGLAVVAALGVRTSGRRAVAEAFALAVFVLPSALQSFEADRRIHTLYALGIAFAVVLLGMAMKRRVYLFGGSGAFVLEVVAKAIQFLVDQRLSVAGWGMLVGGFMIVLAGVFESRKAGIVREQLELVRVGAKKYFATWE